MSLAEGWTGGWSEGWLDRRMDGSGGVGVGWSEGWTGVVEEEWDGVKDGRGWWSRSEVE